MIPQGYILANLPPPNANTIHTIVTTVPFDNNIDTDYLFNKFAILVQEICHVSSEKKLKTTLNSHGLKPSMKQVEQLNISVCAILRQLTNCLSKSDLLTS